MGCGASTGGGSPDRAYADSGSPLWAANEEPTSPKAAVDEMEAELRVKNATRQAETQAKRDGEQRIRDGWK
eukprot:SAG22_NODE_49_length_24620_cov_80.053587_7_plen_71_part_00